MLSLFLGLGDYIGTIWFDTIKYGKTNFVRFFYEKGVIMSKVDWSALKREYISTTKTQKELAEKYSTTIDNISKRCSKENWRAQREAYQDKKVVEQIKVDAKKEIDRYERLVNVTDLLLDKIEAKVKALDDIEMSSQFVKQISSAIKDIKDVQCVKSKEEQEEQKARLEKLRKEIDNGDTNNTIVIKVEGDNASWQK